MNAKNTCDYQALKDALFEGVQPPQNGDDLTTAVEWAMSELSPNWRQVVRMKLIEGKTYAEIVSQFPDLKNETIGKIWIDTKIESLRERAAELVSVQNKGPVCGS